MSRTSSDAIPPPIDPGRSSGYNSPQFSPQNPFETGARRIEQGISQGMGTQALHEELSLMRQAAVQNGSFNLAQYKADVSQIDKKLHADGFLPNIHIGVDGQGHDTVSRDGRQTSDQTQGQEGAPERTSGHPGSGNHHGRRHGRGGHHGRGHHRRGHHGSGEQTSGQGETQGDSQGAPQGDLIERDLQPGGRERPTDRTTPDRKGVDNSDPNVDRSRRSGDPQIWGAPTISAQGIDKVLRENHSPAAGLGNYIYDQAVAHQINPAFALAMYGQESTYGTKGAAVRNNSFGNIRSGSHGFKHYDNIKDGVDDWMNRLSSDSYRGKNLSQIINKYAPASDGNNPRSYMAYVSNNMNKWARSGDDNPDDRRYA